MTIDTAFESSLGRRYSFVKYKSSFEAVFGRDASLAEGLPVGFRGRRVGVAHLGVKNEYDALLPVL